METEVKSLVQKTKSNRNLNYSRYRSLLKILLANNPKITIVEENKESGDISFSVGMEDLGLSVADYVKYKTEIFSNYIVDTVAELLVRENLDIFAKILTKMDVESYTSLISKWEHRRFGMKIVKSNFIFRFHISFLQNLLTEDLKKKMIEEKKCG